MSKIGSFFKGDDSETAKLREKAALAGKVMEGQQAMQALEGRATGVVSTVRATLGQVKGIADSIDLTSSGQKIMHSLAAGMRQATPAVIGAMTAAAQGVRDRVPNSPAKAGPLRGLHGRGIMTEIAKSMDSSPMVRSMDLAAQRTRDAATIALGGPGKPADRKFRPLGGAGAGGAGAQAPQAPVVQGGPITIHVNIPPGQHNPQAIAQTVGRAVQQAVNSSYSDAAS